MANSNSLLDDPTFAVSLSILMLGLALGLPYITFGDFGLDFGTFPNTAITVMRIAIIGMAIAVGMKPLGGKNGF